jgi:hypothetical protein
MAKVINHFLPKPPILGTKEITENGTYAASTDGLDGYSQVTVDVAGGGGEPTTGDYRVRFWDYDGTLLDTQYVNSGEDATPPTAPAHELLDFQEWNESYEHITHDTEIGAIYITKEVTIGEWTGRPSIIQGTNTLRTGTTASVEFVADFGTATVKIAKKVGETYIELASSAVTSSGKIVGFDIGDLGDFELYIYSITNPYAFTFAAFTGNYTFKKLFIGDFADSSYSNFQNAYGLEYITFPSNVTQATGYQAFWNCDKLKALVFPKNADISSIANMCRDCYSLKLFLAPGLTNTNTTRNEQFRNCYAIDTIYMPLIEVMGNYAFSNTQYLDTLYAPMLTTIGNYAFDGTGYAKKPDMPLTSLGTYAYQYARNMKEIVCPAQATLGTNFARYAYSLQKVNIHEDTTSIAGNYSFANCRNLMEVVVNRATFNEETLTVSAGLTVTTSQAILGYSAGTSRGIISVYLGETLVAPENYSATSTTEITFASGIVEGNSVIVRYMRTITTLANVNAFGGINWLAKIYVPDYAIDVYKNFTNWIAYTDYIYPLSELEE